MMMEEPTSISLLAPTNTEQAYWSCQSEWSIISEMGQMDSGKTSVSSTLP